MKKNIFYKALLFGMIFGFVVSCDEGGEPDAGGTTLEEMAGDWFVVGYLEDGTAAYSGDYNIFSTYNASSNDENLWIDDHGAFFEIKTKVQANLDNLTFSGPPNAPELITDGTVTVSNGKIIKDGGVTYGTKTVVDSIYFEAEFDWDPGTTYIFGGHRRTGFLEDDSPTIH